VAEDIDLTIRPRKVIRLIIGGDASGGGNIEGRGQGKKKTAQVEPMPYKCGNVVVGWLVHVQQVVALECTRSYSIVL
jgi:hypothetical protein